MYNHNNSSDGTRNLYHMKLFSLHSWPICLQVKMSEWWQIANFPLSSGISCCAVVKLMLYFLTLYYNLLLKCKNVFTKTTNICERWIIYFFPRSTMTGIYWTSIFSSLNIISVKFCSKINDINRNFSSNSEGSCFVAFATSKSRSQIQIFLFSSK